MPFPVDPRYISAAEEKLSVVFPQNFKNRLVRENGGDVIIADEEWRLHSVLDSSDKKRMARTCNDIVLEIRRLREWARFPASAVAIAGDGSGDQLVFMPDDTNKNELGPAIFLWDHETGELTKVADDFSEA